MLAKKWTVATTSVNPWLRASWMMCCIIGWPTIGSIGFGWLLVRGRSLVPCPPAITTAFMEGNDTGRPVPASGRARGSTRSPTLGRSDRRSHVEPVDDPGDVVGGDPAPEDDPAHGQREPVEPQPE